MNSDRKEGLYTVQFNGGWRTARWVRNLDIDSSWCCWLIENETPKSWGWCDEDFDAIIEIAHFDASDILARLKSLTRYYSGIGGGCECCGSWVGHEVDSDGDWVKFEDIEAIIKQIEKENLSLKF
jgi:hypothetical protein